MSVVDVASRDFPDVDTLIGRRIRQARLANSMTPSELAACAGISDAALARIEAGAERPHPRVVVGLLSELSLSASELFDIEGATEAGNR